MLYFRQNRAPSCFQHTHTHTHTLSPSLHQSHLIHDDCGVQGYLLLHITFTFALNKYKHSVKLDLLKNVFIKYPDSSKTLD